MKTMKQLHQEKIDSMVTVQRITARSERLKHTPDVLMFMLIDGQLTLGHIPGLKFEDTRFHAGISDSGNSFIMMTKA